MNLIRIEKNLLRLFCIRNRSSFLFFLHSVFFLVTINVGDFMNKKDLLAEISSKNIQSVIAGKSSLVLRGILKKCDSLEVVDSDCYEEIDSIKCMKLEDALSYFLDHGDKASYKKLKLYLESMDNYAYERDLRQKGYALIGGVDEVGRGPLVGPVVAACVILPETFSLEGLTDSKK